MGALLNTWKMKSGLRGRDTGPNWSDVRRKNKPWEICVSHSVEGVVVSDRCPGRAGRKVLTGCLLANGCWITEAFALALSRAGWHLLFVAWHIPAANA